MLLVQQNGWRQSSIADAMDEIVPRPLLVRLSQSSEARHLIEELVDPASPTALEARLLWTAPRVKD